MSDSVEKQPPDIPSKPCCMDMTISSDSVSGTLNKRALLLDIDFFEEKAELPLGHFSVGLKRGSLSLAIKNGQMPVRRRGLNATIPTQADSREIDSDNDPYPNESSGGGTNNYTITKVQISTGSYEVSPRWDFEVKGSVEFLKGGRLAEVLGEIRFTDNPCKVDAVFVTHPRDLWISGSDGIWPSNMNGSNRAVRKLLIWRWLKSRFKPILNQITLER